MRALHLEALESEFSATTHAVMPMDSQVLKECDDVLSRAQFRKLRSVVLKLQFLLHERNFPLRVDDSPFAAAATAVSLISLIRALALLQGPGVRIILTNLGISISSDILCGIQWMLP